MSPKALVFDMDGTLLNTLEDLAEATNRTLNQHGYSTHPIDAYRHFVGSGARELIRRALPESARDDTTVEACLATFNAWYNEHWNVNTHLYDGISELLDLAVKENLKIAVLTNKPQAFALQCQDVFLNQWSIDVMQGQEPGLPLKPDAAISQRVTDALQVEPGEVWYFGDSDVDMKTAKNAGYYAIGVTWGFRSSQELADAGAEKLINHPNEIIKELESR